MRDQFGFTHCCTSSRSWSIKQLLLLIQQFKSRFLPGFEIFNASRAKITFDSVTLILTVLHFLKREYETIFVHRFSSETMPIMNLPKNCAHYWIFSGVLLAYFTYQPGFNGGITKGVGSGVGLYALIALWAVSLRKVLHSEFEFIFAGVRMFFVLLYHNDEASWVV